MIGDIMTKQRANLATTEPTSIEDENNIVDSYKKLDQECNVVLEKIKTRKKRKTAIKAVSNDG
jgi:hypothetical protein